jgi:type IV pilus assembly protein PilB
MEENFRVQNGKSGIIESVNRIIRDAAVKNASDIHIDISSREFNIRYRIDGVLEKVGKFSFENEKLEIISRIKIISRMNIAEKRLPQDGSINTIINGKKYDIRVSSIPTVDGESLVLRILKNENQETDFESLGFRGKNLSGIKKLINKNHGLILISGPTGSGKTTTLFAVINKLRDESKKIITVEDPVEKKLAGITQIQVNEKIGLTFLEGLKHILRSDPDIVIIGEIRDKETAEIAVKAALTGHLVIATIHTNDSLSTIFRLIDMGIPEYLIFNSLNGVVAQRLIRKVCVKCRGKSCTDCNSGYNGRISINEVLVFDESIHELFRNTVSLCEIKKKLKKSRFMDILDDACEKERENIINKEEIYRVLGEYNEKIISL